MVNVKLLQNLIVLKAIGVNALETTPSTNTLAADFPVGTLVIADSQTAGRGRSGNGFLSPEGGLYMSLVTDMFLDRPNLATPAAAVAAQAAISEVCGKRTLIKWVNDLYLDGKKVAGILVEKKLSPDRLIFGIGVNLAYTVFPADLAAKATSLFGKAETPAPREALAAAIINNLVTLSTSADDAVIGPYKRLSCLIGRDVTFTLNGQTVRATAVDVTDNGNLIVNRDGNLLTLSSGEVHILNF